jgi:hypothetical protein
MMNKHRGKNFDGYSKEKRVSKEVLELAKQQWKCYCYF